MSGLFRSAVAASSRSMNRATSARFWCSFCRAPSVSLSPRRGARCQSVQLLPLVDVEEQAVGAGLLVQMVADQLVEADRAAPQAVGVGVDPLDALGRRRVLGRRRERLGERVQRLVARAERQHVPGRAAGALAQRREQAGIDQGRLAAAGAADHRDQRVRLDLGGEVSGPVVAAEEEGGVLLAKRQQAAIRADGGLDGGGALGRLAVDRRDQVLQLVRVVGVGAQVDPGLQREEALRLVVEAGQQDRDDREVVLAGLAVEGDLDLAVLPGAHALAEEHGDRAGPAELSFEKRLPGLAGRQAGPIEEAGDAGFAQARADRRTASASARL